MKIFTSFILLFCLFLTAAGPSSFEVSSVKRGSTAKNNAAASKEFQKLVSGKSSIRFRLSSGQYTLNGKFESYQAKFYFNEDLTKSQIEFDIDLSKFTLGEGEGAAQLAFLKTMLENVQFEPAKFKSELIKKQTDGSYLVSGIVSRSGNLWEMGFYLTPEKLTKKNSKFKINLKGDFSGQEFSLPVSGKALVVGEVQFEG